MNARLPICLLALVISLPLAVAGCGNSGPLVMPDVAPADAGVDPDVDNQAADPVDLDEVEAPVADPIPDVDTDDGNG